MDIKITGVTQEIMRGRLDQANAGRATPSSTGCSRRCPRPGLSWRRTRRGFSIQINPDFIGMVIGKGGETIRSLESGVRRPDRHRGGRHDPRLPTEGTKADAAIGAIAALTKEPEVGDTFTGKVVKTTQFGAFVELKKGTDGLLHVSNVGPAGSLTSRT